MHFVLLVTLLAAPSHYATVDGIHVHYKLLGHGRTTLVFVHGLGGEMNLWRDQVEYFAPKARVLVIDLPGYGKSDKPENVQYTMRLFARAVRAAMDDAKIDRVILVGHSMGAAVMREFYREFPERVRGLVSVDGALVMNSSDAPGFSTAPAAVAQLIDPLKGNDYRKNLEADFDAMSAHANPVLRAHIKAVALRVPQHVIVSSLEGMFDPAVWRDDEIKVPLLAVHTTSPMWNAQYVDAVRRLGRDVELTTIADTSHFIMLEQAERLNETIETWMRAK